MKPDRLMMLGAAVTVMGVIVSFFYNPQMCVILTFAGGALFGKGYGIMEARGEV